MNKYDELTKLGDLRDRGILNEEEFQQEKAKILAVSETKFKDIFKKSGDGELFGGLSENAYCAILHLSQFLVLPFNVFGVLVPLLLWFFGKDKSDMVDRSGRIVINWMLSLVIFVIVCLPLCLIYIGYVGLLILLICAISFPIIAAMKASEGVVWNYPLNMDMLTFIQNLGNVDKSQRSSTSGSRKSSTAEPSRTDPGPPVKTHFSQNKYSSERSMNKYQ